MLHTFLTIRPCQLREGLLSVCRSHVCDRTLRHKSPSNRSKPKFAAGGTARHQLYLRPPFLDCIDKILVGFGGALWRPRTARRLLESRTRFHVCPLYAMMNSGGSHCLVVHILALALFDSLSYACRQRPLSTVMIASFISGLLA